MATEIGYWASLSGLTPSANFSLHDHKLAAMRVTTGQPATATVADVALTYYRSLAPGTLSPNLSVSDYEREYYLAQPGVTGLALSLDDLKSRFLATQ